MELEHVIKMRDVAKLKQDELIEKRNSRPIHEIVLEKSGEMVTLLDYLGEFMDENKDMFHPQAFDDLNTVNHKLTSLRSRLGEAKKKFLAKQVTQRIQNDKEGE
jgi:hypothetical protein